MSLLGQLKKWLKDDRGQSTVEYILILSVVIMIAMKFKSEFGKRMTSITEKLGSDIETNFNQQN